MTAPTEQPPGLVPMALHVECEAVVTRADGTTDNESED